MPIESQQKIDPAVTEYALAVENHDCLPGALHLSHSHLKARDDAIFGLRVDSVFWTTSRVDSGGVELRDDSAISLASMADASDFCRGLAPVIEEDAVVATAETEATAPGLTLGTGR